MKVQKTKYEYTVVTTGNLMSFVKLVEILTKQEWKPIGGVSIAHDEGGDVIYAQALTKTTMEAVEDEINRVGDD